SAEEPHRRLPQRRGPSGQRAGRLVHRSRRGDGHHRPGRVGGRLRAVAFHRGRDGGARAPVTAETDMTQLIRRINHPGILVLELSAPPANTYSYEMMKQLDAAILDARMSPEIHVIVLRGAGEKFFCAGADIEMLTKADPTWKYAFCLHANETLNRLEQTSKLTIAALNGHCVGGGLEVAMACDLRIGREGAGKLGLPEVNLGVLPGTGGTQRLARLV